MNPTLLIVRFFASFLLIFAIDYYAYTGLRTATQGLDPKMRQIIHLLYWIISLGLTLTLFYKLGTYDRMSRHNVPLTRLMALFMLFFIPKLVFVVFLFGEDVFRLLKAMLRFVWNWLNMGEPWKAGGLLDERRKFLSQIGLLVAGIPFLGVLHGITKGKYNFTLRKKTLYYPDLPEAFEGFTITQISDIHSGSFDDAEGVKKGVELVKSLNSDLVVFTGDLVNNVHQEMEPWVDYFRGITAKHGVYSILGNHDYGDYIPWESLAAKQENLAALKRIHQEMGFRLLLNQHVSIQQNNTSIYLAGVENWGLPPFPQHGDLLKAMKDIPDNAFRILLSHDPSHWDAQVLPYQQKVHLTLSGHTHGMQFGIEIPGFKWSPVKYKYPRWAGLYEKAEQYLYVNRGFGFLGFPGRVGIWPEVTQLTLRRKV